MNTKLFLSLHLPLSSSPSLQQKFALSEGGVNVSRLLHSFCLNAPYVCSIWSYFIMIIISKELHFLFQRGEPDGAPALGSCYLLLFPTLIPVKIDLWTQALDQSHSFFAWGKCKNLIHCLTFKPWNNSENIQRNESKWKDNACTANRCLFRPVVLHFLHIPSLHPRSPGQELPFDDLLPGPLFSVCPGRSYISLPCSYWFWFFHRLETWCHRWNLRTEEENESEQMELLLFFFQQTLLIILISWSNESLLLQIVSFV